MPRRKREDTTMTISELIEQLKEIKREYGDLEINTQDYRSFACHRFGLAVDEVSDPDRPRLLIQAQ